MKSPLALVLLMLTTLTACSSITPAHNTPAPVEVIGNPAVIQLPGTPASPAPGQSDSGNSGNTQPGVPSDPRMQTWASSLVGQQVTAALQERNFTRAGALVERELGITPRDAYLWLVLSTVRFQENRLVEAEGMAQRALSLSRSKDMQNAANDQLRRIRAARS